MDFAWYIIAFVVAIGVLVTVHEFGHFWVARRLGVKVLRFSVGFGRPLWVSRRGPDQTEYVLAAVPLGGYVKMLDEREGDVAEEDLPRAFNRQQLWVRTAIVLAGPVFNFIFAVFAYWLMFVIGVSGARPWVGEVEPGSVAEQSGLRPDREIVAVDGRETRTWESVIQSIIGAALSDSSIELVLADDVGARRDVTLSMRTIEVDDLTRGHFFDALGFEPQRPRISPVIGEVESGGPASLADLRSGDRVKRANGDVIGSWSDWVDYVRGHPGQVLQVEVERDGRTVELTLTPATMEEAGAGTYGRIGAGVSPPDEELARFYTTVRYGPIESFGRAVGKTYDTTALTLAMFWKMIRLEVSLENLSGPISIAQYAGYTAKVGPSKFIEFLAIVSISLGILNLLPIPVLDGGHLLYYFIELFKGKPVSEETQFLGQRVGIAMLFGLMGLAFYNDLTRIFG